MKQRWPSHELVVSFDNDVAGIASMMKLIRREDRDVKFLRWFRKDTEQKDINEIVVAKNRPDIFANTKLLDHLVFGKLEMKMWLTLNGLWKEEPKISLEKKPTTAAATGSKMLKKRCAGLF